MGAPAQARIELEHRGQRRVLQIMRQGGHWQVGLDGQLASAFVHADDARLRVSLGERQWVLRTHRDGNRLHLFGQDGGQPFLIHDAIAEADHPSVEAGGLAAPMPGRVIALPVQPGAKVTRGQALVVLEAMKMEHSLNAPADGVLKGYRVVEGELVAEGAVLVEFEAD